MYFTLEVLLVYAYNYIAPYTFLLITNFYLQKRTMYCDRAVGCDRA